MELRRALAGQGYRVSGWGLGLNRGARAGLLDRLRQRLDLIADERRVLLVGWSLGGLYARELARLRPDRVRMVATLGSPFSGDPRQNNVWRLYQWVAGHDVTDPPIAHSSAKPPVPTLALWSRRDGIVAPGAARGREGERDEAAEMRCNHMAFGVGRRATREAARRIAAFDRGTPT